ncbi:AAA family ATPase [Agrobacterium rubi]|nr:AAA family ATPase [Agrobacterium rubi]NTF24146.1 AAA family ATPase [Agrobacterium rubi]
MTIEKYKIQGFKSFVEPTEVVIGRGMTGIVGPNGCGKSNLIEALRWGVGETSSKSMRAENGMEDLIFAGTQSVDGRPGRPPRNSAEVVVTLDNAARHAPAEFNDADVLNISRRMERGEGSAYRINGKPALARDVQTLFKDAGFGAKSSAIVSQGKVASIINAKPSERRSILDEAAGTSGLASRRHEADLRLRGTEQNLERAEALEKGLTDQLGSLRKQARQASRRREIDGLIRRAEATAFLVRWRSAADRISRSATAHEANESVIKQMMLDLQSSTARLTELESMAAPLTAARSDAETALALARVSVDAVRKEAAAARNALASAQKNATRTDSDLERERAMMSEFDGEFEDLKDQLSMAEEDRQYDATLIEEAAAVAEEAGERLDEATSALETENSNHVRSVAERKALTDRVARDMEHERQLSSKLSLTTSRTAEIQAAVADLPEQSAEIAGLVETTTRLEADVASAEEETARGRLLESETRSRSDLARSALALMESEIRALSGATRKNSLVSLVSAEPGYEQALAIVLGDGINASIGGIEGRRWTGTTARAKHPDGTEPLSTSVRVPRELEAVISGVGVTEDSEMAETASAGLSPGQAIVTRDGRIWRWDGFRSSNDASAAEDIRRAGRLKELSGEVEASRACAERALVEFEEAKLACVAATSTETSLRDQLRTSRMALDTARRSQDDAIRRRAELEAQLGAAREALASITVEIEEASVRRSESEDALMSLQRQDLGEAALAAARHRQGLAKQAYELERAKLEKTRREADTRVVLIQSIRQKVAEFEKRFASSRAMIAELVGRCAEIRQEIELFEENVAVAPEREADALEALEEAIIAHEAAVERARESEQRLADVRVETRTFDIQIAERREERARLLTEMKAYGDAATELSREISDRLGCQGDSLAEVAGIEDDALLPDLETCDARIQRLHRERENLGIVNLLADDQLIEVETKLGDASKVRDELKEAVRRLRESIAKFDRERRERLTEAFSKLDSNFQDLFSRLFHGGQAYLKLSGSDDILEAGLEIYAAPPGKKMQSMSLLSGGEQALTALAMIFAAFLIRPAPVCVLDEVDAALDDANVDRMCSLVADMARDTTRFLVITHRALTMARCDRLYGVTMAERGVSRMTSLDMEQAMQLVESFLPADSKD